MGINRKDSSTDKPQTQKMILSDCLDACLPVEKCVICTLNELSSCRAVSGGMLHNASVPLNAMSGNPDEAHYRVRLFG